MVNKKIPYINEYGIPEPVSKNIKYPDILLIPLVAYDKFFNRLDMEEDFMTDILKN